MSSDNSTSARRRVLKYGLVGLVASGVLLYGGVLWYFNASEDRLLFSGADRGMAEALPDAAAVLEWDSVTTRAEDGSPVLLLVSPLPDSAAPWVLYFHGAGNTVGAPGNVEHYRILHDVGFSVLAVEYRGYGASRGPTPTEAGLYADAEAGWTFLTEQMGVDPSRIVLFSTSFGSGMATMLATRKEAAGLITKAAYTSAPAAARHRYPWLPAGLLMNNRFDNLGRAPEIDEPWLLLHGEADQVIPIAHARALAAAADGGGRLVVLSGGHNSAMDAGYRDELIPYLRNFKSSLGL